MIVLKSDNSYTDIDTRLQIVSNKIRLYPLLINNSGTDFLTINFKGFQIRPFTLTLLSIDI